MSAVKLDAYIMIMNKYNGEHNTITWVQKYKVCFEFIGQALNLLAIYDTYLLGFA